MEEGEEFRRGTGRARGKRLVGRQGGHLELWMAILRLQQGGVRDKLRGCVEQRWLQGLLKAQHVQLSGLIKVRALVSKKEKPAVSAMTPRPEQS